MLKVCDFEVFVLEVCKLEVYELEVASRKFGC